MTVVQGCGRGYTIPTLFFPFFDSWLQVDMETNNRDEKISKIHSCLLLFSKERHVAVQLPFENNQNWMNMQINGVGKRNMSYKAFVLYESMGNPSMTRTAASREVMEQSEQGR